MRTFLKAFAISALTAAAGAILLRIAVPPEPPTRRPISDELTDEQREELLEELGGYT